MQKISPKNISLTRTVITILLAIIIVIQATVGGIIYAWQYSKEFKDLSIQLQEVTELAALHLESPIWNFDNEQLIQIVHNFMLIPSISRLTIRSQSGTVLEDHIRDEKTNPSTKAFYNQKKEIIKEGQPLGTVEVSISTDRTNERLIHYLISITFSIIILSLVQIVTIYLLLRKTIIQPLKSIENYASGISSGTTVLPDPPKGIFTGELKKLHNSISTMIVNLQNSEKNYRSIFENSLEGIFQTNLEGVFIKANSALAEILGYHSPDELIMAVISIEQLRLFQTVKRFDLLESIKDKGFVAGQELTLRRKDGHTLYCLISMRPVSNDQGEFVFFEGSLIDITARKLAEAQLARLNQQLETLVEQRTKQLNLRNDELIASEERYRNLVETMQEGILAVDSEGRLTYVNRQMSNIVGKTTDELIGSYCIDFIEETQKDYFETKLKAANNQAAPKYEINWSRVDGQSVSTLVTPTALYDKESQYLGSFAVVTDISNLKELQAQLLRAQKLESIGQLAAGLAHEINTPTQYVVDNARFLDDAFKEFLEVLSAYESLSDAIKNGLPTSTALDQVQISRENHQLESLFEEIPGAFHDIFEGLDRIVNIVSSVKRFAHPGQNAIAPVDLNDAIQSTITVSTNEWKYVAEIQADLDPDLPPVSCDISAINQVVLNLIVNAAHAIADQTYNNGTDKGTIAIQTRKQADFAEIRISDTGGGIPEDIRSRIFDPFFTTKVVGKGTGQGLAIARAIITETHHGSIDFETKIGHGTTFIIRLPLIS